VARQEAGDGFHVVRAQYPPEKKREGRSKQRKSMPDVDVTSL
jgi:hypothetical protein